MAKSKGDGISAILWPILSVANFLLSPPPRGVRQPCPLIDAVTQGDVQQVQLLLVQRADPNSRETQVICRHRMRSYVVDVPENVGKTALMLAASDARQTVSGKHKEKIVKTALTCLIALTMAGAACAADTPMLKADNKDESVQQLIKAEHAMNEAFKARDRETLGAVLSEDYLFTGEDGKALGKQKFIGEAAGIKVVSYTMSELVGHTYGDTGILNGQWKGRIAVDQREEELTLRFTDTFVRRDGRWWAVAGHMTRIGGDGPGN